MSYTSIEEVNKLEANELVSKMKVYVRNAFDPTSGVSKKYGKPWKVQAATLADSTGEIRGSFFNSNIDLRSLKGSEITISSSIDSKGILSGITTEDYTNKSGEIIRQLKIVEQADINEVLAGEETQQNKSDKTPSGENYIKTFESSEHEKRESIERQVSLREAVNLFCASQNPPRIEMVIDAAEKFYRFLSGADKVI